MTEDEIQRLFNEIRDNDNWVRMGAIETLGKIGPDARGAVSALTKALRDEDKDKDENEYDDEEVPQMVKEALRKIEGKM